MNLKQMDSIIETLILISLLAENLAKQFMVEQELAKLPAIHVKCSCKKKEVNP